jgi:DNA-binding NarL/FixJ family response regulator
VFIIDEQPIVQEGLCRLIDAADDMEFAGATTTGPLSWKRAMARRPDIVITDLRTKLLDRCLVLREVVARYPTIKILVFSEDVEPGGVVRLIAAGAGGCLGKDQAGVEILAAMRKVAAGETYVSPSMGGRIAEIHSRAASPALSARENEVLRLVGSGLSLTEIGQRLGLSPKTVSTYRSRVLKKLGFRGNSELVRYVASRGWITE